MIITTAQTIPEQGQLVQVRGRHFLVQDVQPYQAEPHAPAIHRVSLECLDDDRLGEPLDLIWEREVAPAIHDTIGLPQPTAWDLAGRFQAFLHAIEWSTSSLLDGEAIQAPFRGAIEIEEYQLEPVARALVMPRVNLLIADDVGLGKTIEAGMVLQELLARQRIRRALVICPASLQRQWQEELRDKFQLHFELIDRDHINRLRREYGLHVNPWNSFPRLITSMDFLKREQPLRLFRESLQRQGQRHLYDWDLLLIDEAHNVAPAGRKTYIRDSDRTRMVNTILDHFEHRLFLTATPHNGYTESFTALLEMLDPLRFSRGPTVDPKQVKVVMVRRLKDAIVDALGGRKFARRHVEPLWVDMADDERRLHDLLGQYTRSRLERVDFNKSLTIRFALTLLKKRLLSSPRAFALSLEVHRQTLGQADTAGDEAAPDEALAERLRQRADEEWADDEAKARAEEDALQENSRFFRDLTAAERRWLADLHQTALALQDQPDRKTELLLDWIRAHLRPNGDWNQERLIIFTEYRDTLAYLAEIFAAQGWGERVMTLVGGMNSGDREAVKTAFQTAPAANAVRILLATDAASEGLNLQNHCRYLVHMELPWNPNRLEQRNGRIDRHGQPASDVYCYHFVYRDHADSRFLQTVVDKVQTMRADLGSVGEVIAAQVEEALLGRREGLVLPEERRRLVQEQVQADLLTEQDIRKLGHQLNAARRQWQLYPDNMQRVLHEALHLSGHSGLEAVSDGPLAGKAWWLKNVPPHWAEGRTAIEDEQGRLRMLVFDHSLARHRRDVALIHLNHPLMQRALGLFRAQLWAEGLTAGEPLRRISYRVLPDYKLDGPLLVAFARVVAISALGQKLHEALIPVGAQIRQRELEPLSAELLAGPLSEPGDFPAIPSGVAQQLRQYFPAHEKALQKLLEQRQRAEESRLKALLKEKIKQETSDIRQLMQTRIKEIDQRLHELSLPGVQTGFNEQFEPEERLQFQEDLAWLERKRDHLRERLSAEPERIQQRYTLRSVRLFPVGLLYLLPEGLI